MYRTTFPDLQVTVDDLIAEGDQIVARWTARGTHRGELMGTAPTGKAATIMGIIIDRFAGGRIAEEWVHYDALSMLQQLGVSSVPGQAGS